MNFLLDTNVISDWVKPRPNPGLAAWLAAVDEDRVFLSVVTLAELRYGIERLAGGSRRDRLDAWLTHELPLRFEGRILSIDSAVADAWGRLTRSSEALGRPIGSMDAFLSATAHVHKLMLITRNVTHFHVLGHKVLNPWS